MRLPLIVLTSLLLLASACDRSTESAAVPDEPTAITPIAGLYEVSGTTIETGTGQKRDIAGSVILAEGDGSYTATFHLNTTFEGEQGVLPAEVIGTGSGTIEGNTLRGTAETQVVISSVPGIDPAFAFIPRATTTRLVSNSVTSIANDGTVVITIENEGASGEVYRPTRTTLRGSRAATPVVAGGTLPSVATAPPDDAADAE